MQYANQLFDFNEHEIKIDFVHFLSYCEPWQIPWQWQAT